MSLERVGQIGEATGGLVASAGRSATTPSPFDVWTHSVAGLAESIHKGDVSSVPVPVPGVMGVKLAKAAAHHWHRTSLGGFAKASEQQKALIGKQLADLFHAGDHPPQGFLQHVGAAFGLATSIEQLATMHLGMIPFPAFPAVRIGDFDVGIPHAHAHPPNLIPPATVPIRLPSTGPVIPIPILSGANSVLINNMPAARCGDMGLGIWCGGFVPLYEIFLGSSNVWIEGCRAARLGVDITHHCLFSVRPKPGDPPIGSFNGFTISSSSNVLIGGIPLPSLTSMAMGAAFKAMFKGLGKVVQKIRAARAAQKAAEAGVERNASTLAGMGPAKPPRCRGMDRIDYAANYVRASRLIEEMEKSRQLVINGTMDFIEAAKRDLRRIACSDTGRKALEEIRASGRKVVVEHLNDGPRKLRSRGPHAAAHDIEAARNGKGSDSTIRYDPSEGTPATPSDAIANHELGHARDNALGNNRSHETFDTPQAKRRWSTPGEFDNITGHDNAYRRERGLPERSGHGDLPYDLPY